MVAVRVVGQLVEKHLVGWGQAKWEKMRGSESDRKREEVIGRERKREGVRGRERNMNAVG